MDSKRFDSLAKMIGRRRSRRDAFQALAAAGLAAAATRTGLAAEPATAAQVAVERRFDCKAVGEKCNGKDSACCSGRCQGKGAKKGRRGKKDRRDKSKCVAHDQGGCTGDHDTCLNSQAVACGFRARGGCLQTTGNANFCGEIEGSSPPRLRCEVCTTDKDCENLGYGRGAACVVCESDCEFRNNNATACAGSAA
jgi:hypothetical protein